MAWGLQLPQTHKSPAPLDQHGMTNYARCSVPSCSGQQDTFANAKEHMSGQSEGAFALVGFGWGLEPKVNVALSVSNFLWITVMTGSTQKCQVVFPSYSDMAGSEFSLTAFSHRNGQLKLSHAVCLSRAKRWRKGSKSTSWLICESPRPGRLQQSNKHPARSLGSVLNWSCSCRIGATDLADKTDLNFLRGNLNNPSRTSGLWRWGNGNRRQLIG
jgi:hypothetical protein